MDLALEPPATPALAHLSVPAVRSTITAELPLATVAPAASLLLETATKESTITNPSISSLEKHQLWTIGVPAHCQLQGCQRRSQVKKIAVAISFVHFSVHYHSWSASA